MFTSADLATEIGSGKSLVAAGDRRQIDGGERPLDEHRRQLMRIAREADAEIGDEHADDDEGSEIEKSLHGWSAAIIASGLRHAQANGRRSRRHQAPE